ncbi:unnamed protein product [Echinostoma caproni]|uniref:Uncharacterized protein n=1 Tax=Echinostoma caproni TaxID=27848 RepID=A0A183AX99_9TREM|nr:unnamed protein product [Echinostoma caproni]
MYRDNLNPFADPHDLTRSGSPPAASSSVEHSESAKWPSNQEQAVAFDNVVLNDENVEQSFPGSASATDSGKHSSQMPFSREKNSEQIEYQGTEAHHSPVSNGGRYEDFETIDWVKDIARDRCRHRDLHAKRVNYQWSTNPIIAPDVGFSSSHFGGKTPPREGSE